MYKWKIIRKILHRDYSYEEKLAKKGLIYGKNFSVQGGVIIDDSHCWLISIGDNVTLAPRVHILAHDASTKIPLGYTRIERVKIGNNVFIGASTIILPGVTIGNNVIVGAGSVVTKNIPNGTVVAGNPAKVIKSYDEYIFQQKEKLKISPKFDRSFIDGQISKENKENMILALENTEGYII